MFKSRFFRYYNFDTSHVTNFEFMFDHCTKIKSLDLTNFRTNSAINLVGLFADCPSLTSLDLLSFDTSHTQLMNTMFFNCQQLKEINLENFNTSFLMNMDQMFQYCYNLEYINFKEYNEHNSFSFGNTLEGVRNNLVICLDENNENKYIEQFKTVLAEKTCHRIYCGDDWRSHIKKIVPETGGCADDCSDYKYENNNYCFSTCPEGANFCTPDSEYIETTNIITTYNNEINIKETTNMITTNNVEENKVITSLNYYIDSSSQLISETNTITTLITANYEGKRTTDIIFSQISSSQKYNPITDKTNKNLIFSSSFLINSNNKDNTIEEPKNDKTYLITGINNEAIFVEVKDIMDDYDPSK